MKTHKMHYAVADRPHFTKKQGELFVNLFTDKNLRTLAYLHYVKGKTLLECAEAMNYSARHIERLHSNLKNIAIEQLMNLVDGQATTAMKLLKIKNIVCQGDE